MIQLGHTPGSFTYTTSIDALCRLYERMIEVGCFRSVQTCNMLISMFLKWVMLMGHLRLGMRWIREVVHRMLLILVF
jgi:hypothetical protein